MKVLIVSKAFVTSMYRKKLEELAALGGEVIAVAPAEWREGGGVQRLESGSSSAYDLRVLPIRLNGHFHLHYYPQLPSLLREVAPDLVHIDEEPYNTATYLGVRASRSADRPSLFFTWQNILRQYPPPFRWMEASVYRTVAHGLAGNVEAAAVLEAKGFRKPVTVVPQFGVDPSSFRPAARPPGTFTVGFLNRLIPAKAPLLALHAFSSLPKDARMRIVGDGPLRPQVQSEIERLGLGNRVRVLGRVPSAEMPALMRELSAVILPSLTTPSWKEQFGRVLVEAMCSGVPVVGSDSGEIPRVIGDAGLTVPEGDQEALAAALRRLHDDAELANDLRRRGRVRAVEHFSHRRIAEITMRAYREAIR